MTSGYDGDPGGALSITKHPTLYWACPDIWVGQPGGTTASPGANVVGVRFQYDESLVSRPFNVAAVEVYVFDPTLAPPPGAFEPGGSAVYALPGAAVAVEDFAAGRHGGRGRLRRPTAGGRRPAPHRRAEQPPLPDRAGLPQRHVHPGAVQRGRRPRGAAQHLHRGRDRRRGRPEATPASTPTRWARSRACPCRRTTAGGRSSSTPGRPPTTSTR